MREIPCKYLLTFFYMFHLIDKFSVIIITHMTCLNCTGSIQESKGMHASFKKKGKKRHLKIWAKMFKI